MDRPVPGAVRGEAQDRRLREQPRLDGPSAPGRPGASPSPSDPADPVMPGQDLVEHRPVGVEKLADRVGSRWRTSAEEGGGLADHALFEVLVVLRDRASCRARTSRPGEAGATDEGTTRQRPSRSWGPGQHPPTLRLVQRRRARGASPRLARSSRRGRRASCSRGSTTAWRPARESFKRAEAGATPSSPSTRNRKLFEQRTASNPRLDRRPRSLSPS